MSPTLEKKDPGKELLLDEKACALPILAWFIDRFGKEALDWSPITIHMELRDELGREAPEENFSKLMAGVQLLSDNGFYKSLPDFIRTCLALSGEPPSPIADAGDCAWGVTEAMLISPPGEDDPEPFTDEIRAYIGKALDSEGILSPPDVLRIALRDKGGLAEQARHDFTDDPEMYSAVFGVEKEKTGAIDKMIRARTRLLLTQLRSLPLETGSAEELCDKLLKRLDEMEQAG